MSIPAVGPDSFDRAEKLSQFDEKYQPVGETDNDKVTFFIKPEEHYDGNRGSKYIYLKFKESEDNSLAAIPILSNEVFKDYQYFQDAKGHEHIFLISSKSIVEITGFFKGDEIKIIHENYINLQLEKFLAGNEKIVELWGKSGPYFVCTVESDDGTNTEDKIILIHQDASKRTQELSQRRIEFAKLDLNTITENEVWLQDKKGARYVLQFPQEGQDFADPNLYHFTQRIYRYKNHQKFLKPYLEQFILKAQKKEIDWAKLKEEYYENLQTTYPGAKYLFQNNSNGKKSDEEWNALFIKNIMNNKMYENLCDFTEEKILSTALKIPEAEQQEAVKNIIAYLELVANIYPSCFRTTFLQIPNPLNFNTFFSIEGHFNILWEKLPINDQRKFREDSDLSQFVRNSGVDPGLNKMLALSETAMSKPTVLGSWNEIRGINDIRIKNVSQTEGNCTTLIGKAKGKTVEFLPIEEEKERIAKAKAALPPGSPDPDLIPLITTDPWREVYYEDNGTSFFVNDDEIHDPDNEKTRSLYLDFPGNDQIESISIEHDKPLISLNCKESGTGFFNLELFFSDSIEEINFSRTNEGHIIIQNRSTTELNLFPGQNIIRGLPSIDSYYVFESVKVLMNGTEIQIVNKRGADPTNPSLATDLVDGGDLLAAAVDGKDLLVSDGSKVTLYRNHDGKPHLKPYIAKVNQLINSRTINLQQLLVAYNSNAAEKTQYPGMDKFLKKLIKLKRMIDLDPEEGLSPYTEEVLRTILKLEDDSKLNNVIQFLMSKGVKISDFHKNFIQIHVAQFPQGEDFSIHKLYIHQNYYYIHTKNDAGLESIYCFDRTTLQQVHLDFDGCKILGSGKKLYPNISLIQGTNLQVEFRNDFVFIKSNHEIKYQASRHNEANGSFLRNSIIFNIDYGFMLSDVIMDKISEWNLFTPPYSITDFKIVYDSKPLTPSCIAVLISNGAKTECLSFVWNEQKKTFKILNRQEEASEKVSWNNEDIELNLEENPEETDSAKKPLEESKNLEDQNSIHDDSLSIQMYPSRTLHYATLITVTSSVVVGILTAITITPIIILQPGLAVVIKGFTINISLLIVASTGSSTVLILIAVSSVLWILNRHKEKAFKRMENDLNKQIMSELKKIVV